VKLRLFLCLALFATPSVAAAQCMLCAQSGAKGTLSTRSTETPLRVEVDTQLDLSRVILPKFRKVQPCASPDLDLSVCGTRRARPAVVAPARGKLYPPNERAG